MANPEHLEALLKGGAYWNAWRQNKPEVRPDFTYADIGGKVGLAEAYLHEADFALANLSGTNLTGAVLYRTNFSWADLSRANLTRANLQDVNFTRANLSEATIVEAGLSHARFDQTDMRRARITDCTVYGVAAWRVDLEGAVQSNLVITSPYEPKITVDDLAVAQFIYLLLNNRNVRTVLDTLSSKVVLILGRFTPQRKKVLDKLRELLGRLDYLPVMFDSEPPAAHDLTETVATLARMSRFILADVTDPRSVPHELASIIPDLRSVPMQPLIWSAEAEYDMFDAFRSYPWVLETYRYDSAEDLVASLSEKVIAPAESKARELQGLKGRA
jgi:hypothetical protein